MCHKEIFNYLDEREDLVLEQEVDLRKQLNGIENFLARRSYD